MDVMVKRLSNSEDRIPLTISERLIDVIRIIPENSLKYPGSSVRITGMKNKKIDWYCQCLSVNWNL